ncbi:MAG: serine/threonine protein kinase/formylglycine-generating enzyme required for sulfatase activity [Pirellulaceae bacterium]|jgi:serine/threonine protein kinase/formylglycine-generating enzyme required for sulfatase activity
MESVNKPQPSIPATEKLQLDQISDSGSDEPTSSVDSNLLFGKLAVVNGLVEQQIVNDGLQLLAPNHSLGSLLVDQGLLNLRDREAIEHLVRSHADRRSGESSSEIAESTVSRFGEVDTSTFSPNPNQPKPIATEFGDYRILEEIARGGMGVVYKARHTKLNRVVALKMIRAGELANEEQVRRFYSEAEAAAKLDHPGIVPVFEVGELDGQHFFSMAFVDGPNLRAKVKDGPLDPAEAATITRAVAEAVHFAHENEIIHRDIKPHNILLDKQGKPRVTDFGLAKHLLGDSELTKTGHVMGTPSFMAPEQAAGNAHLAGAAADVYSIGATLYCLLTGRPPIQAASTLETVRQVIEAEPAPPRRLNPAIPRDLETICLKCLRKSPAQRYSSAAALAEDLQRWLDNKPILARRATVVEKAWLWCKRKPAVAGSIATVLLAIAIASSVVIQQRSANQASIAAAALENNKERADTLTKSVLAAPAAGIPFAIQLLRPLQEHAKPLLQAQFENPAGKENRRLHAAFALAEFGDVKDEYLVEAIERVNAAECPNMVWALSQKQDSLDLIKRRAAIIKSNESPNWNHLARLAVVAIYLDDPTLAAEMCQQRPNPIQRTIFIDTLPTWHGDFAVIAKLLRETDNSLLRYSILLGVAQTDESSRTSFDAQDWRQLLTDLHQNSASAAVHSAADFAKRKLEFGPSTETDNSARNQWMTNALGMTMLRIPSGTFDRDRVSEGKTSKQMVTITKPFWLADRETTLEHYREFLNDSNYPIEKKPTPTEAKPDGFKHELKDWPVDTVSWEDAILFCNWLSHKEGLNECYKLETDRWKWEIETTGYRLPTEGEWELACRAKSTTAFMCGEDETFIGLYGTCRAQERTLSACLIPNSFGLFDMPGNVHEWCFDVWSRAYVGPDDTVDPIADSNGNTPLSSIGRVTRGGSYTSSAFSLRSGNRYYGPQTGADTGFGFRVGKSEN